VEDTVLRAQCKESDKQEDQLNLPIIKYSDNTEERGALLLEAQLIAADGDALKLEQNNLQAQQRAVALLKKKLNLISMQCDKIAKERDSFKLRSRRSEEDRKAISKVIKALKVGTEELLAQFNDYSQMEKYLNTVRQQCEDAKKERHFFIIRAKFMAQSKESIKIERDALKLEIENLRAKVKYADLLETQLNVVTEDCDSIAKERDSLIQEAQHVGTDTEATEEDSYEDALLEDQINVGGEDCDNISIQRDSLILEAHHMGTDREATEGELEDTVQLEEQLNILRMQCDDIAKERHSFKLTTPFSEVNKKALNKVIEALNIRIEEIRAQFNDYALLAKQLNTIRQQYENVKKERMSLILRAQLIAESTEAITFETEALRLEKENLTVKIKNGNLLEIELNPEKLHGFDIKKGRDFYKLKTRWTEGNREASGKDIDDLNLQKEELRAQCKNCTVQEKKLKTVREQCENINRERNDFTLRAQCTAADTEATREERDALKLVTENLRTQGYDAALKEKQFNIIREDSANIVKESLMFEAEQMETDRQATEEDLDGAALLEEYLNIGREDCDNIAQEGDSLIQGAQHVGTDRQATEDDWYEGALSEEQLNIIKEDSANFVKELESLIFEAEQMETDRQATEEDLDDAALLEEQVNIIRENWYNIEKRETL
jgi:hypothetical protein